MVISPEWRQCYNHYNQKYNSKNERNVMQKFQSEQLSFVSSANEPVHIIADCISSPRQML